ncbi:hypothetical protein EI94DRAFT_822625 [Lactarius quietus]|nr:hypothetical protein EI94DRAFT_822625 [Lactarius quietus]
MYLERAEEEDGKMAESWKGDAEGILVFTGLFSAVVATLLQVAAPSLQPSSQDASAFYLANVYQLLSSENGSQYTIPSSISSLDPASFAVPTSAVWVNSLWFLSLAISITCALLATLLQQWARRYLRLTNPRCSPHKRARIRAFFAEGVQNRYLPWTVEALPTLLHISLFLFFAGLGVYLFGIHQTVFSVVMAWVGLCVVVYAYVTALPIVYKDSPYHAPLSSFLWFCVTCVRAAFPAADFPPPRHNRQNPTMPGSFDTRDPEEDRSRSLFPHSLRKMAEEYAGGLPAEIDYRALSWTFNSLDQDRELEQFFEGVPGFCTSAAVDNPVGGFIKPNNWKLSSALTGLMDRTLSSSLVHESVKQRRITICTKAISAANLFGPWWLLPRVLLGEWQAFLRSIDFGLFLKDWGRVDRPITTYYAQCAVAVIISSVQEQARDDRWVQLVARQIEVSKSALRNYLSHGDSILLASLNLIVRQTLQISWNKGEHCETYIKNASSRTLESICKLDAQNSSAELQHDFCKAWNEHVHAAENDKLPYVRNISLATLKNIRKVYVALHEATHPPPTAFAFIDDSDPALDDITSYPICTIDGHDSALSNGQLNSWPNLQGQGHVGNATQMPVALPVPAVSSRVSLTSTATMTFPTPFSSPPVVNASPIFGAHQNPPRPSDQRAIPVDHSASQVPSIRASTLPSFPVVKIPTAAPDPLACATKRNP